MDPWQWVTDWKDFLPSASLVALLEKHFFPKWLQVISLFKTFIPNSLFDRFTKVLASWLNHSPNYTEVTSWYQGWKKEFYQVGDLLAHAQVKAFLNQALEMMNNAVTGNNPMAMQPGTNRSTTILANLRITPFQELLNPSGISLLKKRLLNFPKLMLRCRAPKYRQERRRRQPLLPPMSRSPSINTSFRRTSRTWWPRNAPTKAFSSCLCLIGKQHCNTQTVTRRS